MTKNEEHTSAAPSPALNHEQQADLKQRIESLQNIVVQLLAENERLRQGTMH